MVVNVHDLVLTLNNLIQVCKDSQEGFRTAAGESTDLDLKDLFYRTSQQRLLFAAELQQLVETFRQEPVTRGSFGATLHRRWRDFKSAFTTKTEASILAERDYDEDGVGREYEDALASDLPLEVRLVVEQQLDQVQETQIGIRELREAVRAHC